MAAVSVWGGAPAIGCSEHAAPAAARINAALMLRPAIDATPIASRPAHADLSAVMTPYFASPEYALGFRA
jgi:hypothetical protein